MVNSLPLAFLEPAAEFILAAVAGGSSAHVELQEAGLVCRVGLVAPDYFALLRHGRALAVEAVAAAAVALDGVLDVEVLRALTAHAGAQLRQVALVLRLPANRAGRPKLQQRSAPLNLLCLLL